MGIIYRNGIPYTGTGKAARFFAATGDGAIDGSSATLKSIAEKAGDIYICQTAGTLYGISFKVGDAIIFKNAVVAGTAPTSSDFAVNKGTDSDTTYSAGTGLSLSGTTLNHSNSVTAGTASGDNSKTLSFGGTFTIPSVTYDSQGHITSNGTTTMTMPENPNSDTKVTNTLSTTTKAYVTGTSSSTTNTGTQFFDTGVYLTSAAGELAATTFSGKLKGTIDSSTTATTQTQGNNSTKIATTAYVDTAISDLPSPMVFRGSLGTGGTITALPTDGTAAVGDTYKVITAGTYSSQAAKVGDIFICDSKTSSANTWTYIPSADDVNTIPSAYCDTAGNVDYKFAQCTDYTLLSNSYIQLILKNANTSTSKLYLAIGNNGLQSYKSVYINGSVSSSSNYTLPAGTYLVYYDGTSYYLRTDGKITSTGIVNTSNTELYTNNTGTVTGSSLTSNNIIIGNSDTAIKSSGKTIATSITDVDTTVPTSKAVKTYVDGLIGNKYVLCSTAASTGTKVIDSVGGYTSYQDIPEGTTIHVLFENANTSSSNTLLKFSADSLGVAILPNKLQWPAKTLLSLTKMPDTSGSSTSYWQSTASYTYSTERVNIADYSSQANFYPIPICSNTTGDIRLGGNGKFSYKPSTRELRVGSIVPESDLTTMSISGGTNGTMNISGEKALNITGGTASQSTGIKMTDSSSSGIVIKSTSTTTGSGVKIAGKAGVYLAGALSSDGDPVYGFTVTTDSVTEYGTVPTLTAANLKLQGTNALMLQGANWPTGTANAAHINSDGYIIKNTSSRRYKNSIDYNLNYEDYHNQLMQLKPCTFKYNEQPNDLQLGLIAEDVEEINSNIVVHEQDGAPDGLKDRDLITLLIIESQKKDKEIAALKEDIEDLKQRLAAIEDIIN